MTATDPARSQAFGQDQPPTPVDRVGIWLSARRLRRAAGGFAGRRVADIGCGYDATFARSIRGEAATLLVMDLALSPEVEADPLMVAIEGVLPAALAQIPSTSLDVVVCNSVLEHLWDPGTALVEFHRILAPGGAALINVPSWRGKRFLEFSAFRLGTSPAAEMDDHKTYYDPRDLWPMLVLAGFAPSRIHCFRHKAGLNTFAVCRKEDPREGS